MTRRLILIRWLFYGAVTLLILLLQSQLLGRFTIWGVYPVIIPCMAAVVATLEPPRHATVFALVLGAISDTLFTAPMVCFYVLVCVVATGVSVMVARHLVMPGFRCSLACCAIALLLCGGLSAVTMLHRGAEMTTVMGLLLRETIVSLPFAVLLTHPGFTHFHRITSPR